VDNIKILESLKKQNIIKDKKYNCRLWKTNENKLLKTIIENCQIQDFISFQEKMWYFLNEFKERPKCGVCDKNTTLNSVNGGFKLVCSRSCSGRSVERKEKIKQTSLLKYGVEHPTQSQHFRDSIAANIKKLGYHPGGFGTSEHKTAVQKKYGVDNPFQSKLVKNKIKITNNDRYGVDNPQENSKIREQTKKTKINRYGTDGWNPSKTKETMNEKYGVDYPQQNAEIRERTNQTNLKKYGQRGFNPIKVKETMNEKYGVDYPLQNIDIFEKCQKAQTKAQFKYKEKILPSGRKIFYQGYEGYVIDYILQSNLVNEEDIENERFLVPVIPYIFENKKRKYFPDIFIKSKNMLIEVKSNYTYAKDINKNLAKQNAAKQLGFRHIIIIWDIKNNWVGGIV